MSTLDESSSARNQMASALEQGADRVSQFQQVTFTKYRRVILPADGFVFWVKNSILSTSALLDSAPLNRFYLNKPLSVIATAKFTQAQQQATLPDSFVVPGSLHYSTSLAQDEEETFSTNQVVFTAQAEVNPLNIEDPDILYLANYDGIRFAFSGRDNFYRQAGLWHYTGNAVYADMFSQIIDDKRQLNTRQMVVSNSLPIWLSMNAASGNIWDRITRPGAALFPSFLTHLNMVPPFVAVHIPSETTKLFAAAATVDGGTSQMQLVHETVKLTLFGMNNDSAQDLVQWILQYANDNPTVLGIMNSPVLRDEKRIQVELQALSQKKTVEFEVNYYQSRTRAIARQLLLQAQTTVFVADTPLGIVA